MYHHSQRRKSERAPGWGLGRFLEAKVSRKRPCLWNVPGAPDGREPYRAMSQLELRVLLREEHTKCLSLALWETSPYHQSP